tara:strand:- start:472 stop:771 length:300 start_codon:yes stop_codon:yes gene_type:complete
MTHLLDDREAAVAFFQKHLEVKTGHTPHIWDMDGAVHLSAEENTDGITWADYYDGGPQDHPHNGGAGYPYVNPAVYEIAEAHDCFVEWKNPGCVCIHKA